MGDFGELVLVVGDCHIPHRAAAISEQFKVCESALGEGQGAEETCGGVARTTCSFASLTLCDRISACVCRRQPTAMCVRVM